MPAAALLSLATSVPPHTFLQKDVLAAAWDIFGSRFPDYDRFASIYSNTGIIRRYGVKPFEWYLTQRGWPERTEAFLEGAEALFIGGGNTFRLIDALWRHALVEPIRRFLGGAPLGQAKWHRAIP